MTLRNFSEFLIEKKNKSDEIKVWKPGSDPWFLEYFSQIKIDGNQDRLIKLTKEDLEKIIKDFSKIDTTLKWEKLYEFAKYCLSGEKDDYPSRFYDEVVISKNAKVGTKDKSEDIKEEGLVEKIRNIKISGGKIESVLKSIKKEDISKYTKEIYSSISLMIQNLSKSTEEKDKVFIEKTFLGHLTKETLDPELEKLKSFNASTDVFYLLAGLYQPKEGNTGKPIFTGDSTLSIFKNPAGENGSKEDIKAKKDLEDSSLWSDDWSVDINPDTILPLMTRSEMCIRNSLGCISQMQNLVKKDTKNKLDDEVLALEEIIKSIEDDYRVKYLMDDAGNKDGEMYVFYKKNWEGGKRKEGIKASDIIKSGEGLTFKESKAYASKLEEAKKQVSVCKSLCDSGKMSEYEYEDNVSDYDKDADGKKVKVGEGLRSAMYAEVKEAFSFFQSAIDNYCTSSEGNALDEYLKTYKEFIENSKEDYSISKDKDGNQVIEFKSTKKEEDKGEIKNKKEKK
jgi:hypothetical protein